MRQSKDKALKGDGTSAPTEELPFRVELWHDGGGDAVERILARAANAQLARAIFRAAQGEHPERRITLRKDNRIIADSAK
ncbi:MAG: hypothetical protein JO141_04595 [Bradyrhizobium sp.]|nr:hypothetical protein [Bradyrhizobium sp.]